MVGWSGGWVAGKAEIITNSAQLGLGLGLSLAKIKGQFNSDVSFNPNSIQYSIFNILLCCATNKNNCQAVGNKPLKILFFGFVNKKKSFNELHIIVAD